MKLSIVTACCGRPGITRAFLQTTVRLCRHDPEVVIVDNGSSDTDHALLLRAVEESRGQGYTVAVVRVKDPLGSSKALNVGLKHATGDVAACIHNDVEVHEAGWDGLVLGWFAAHPHTGVAGFAGARVMNLHGRETFYSSLSDAAVHGYVADRPMRVAVLDGLSIIGFREDLLSRGGFDERYVHHFYDLDICVAAHLAGRENWLLPIKVSHHSGQTSVASPAYTEWAMRVHGGDTAIHRAATAAFQAKWRGRLPINA